MIRKIVKINEDKCNGCGACAHACHEGAIVMENGKAKLISDIYCDGLGDCLPACPTGAIEIIERDADEYDEKAVANLKNKTATKAEAPLACGCPGTMARAIPRHDIRQASHPIKPMTDSDKADDRSELRQWPVQLALVNPDAGYFQDAELLVAADCTAYAYAGFHRDFIKDHVTVIGCPKLDDLASYGNKLKRILEQNEIKSITVVRMEVPCCGGIVQAVKEAMLNSRKIVPYKEVRIGIDGDIKP